MNNDQLYTGKQASGIVVPNVVATPTGEVFFVTTRVRSAKDAINALNCQLKFGFALTPENVPMIIRRVQCKVRAVVLDEAAETEEVFEKFPNIVDPLTLFAFGAKYPFEQIVAQHITIWMDAISQFWAARLFVREQKREVSVFQVSPRNRFGKNSRILTLDQAP